jgi:hypothetical protein
MDTHCPSCKKDFNLTVAQEAKLVTALENLRPGQTLKFGCPHCKETVALTGGKAESKTTETLDISVMEDVLYSEHESVSEDEVSNLVKSRVEAPPKPVKLPPTAPKPPDVGWLASGELKKKDVVKDVPRALVLMPEGEPKATVEKALIALGYQPETTESPDAAVDRMRFVNFGAVVMHTGYEGGTPEESEFHQYMCGLPMSKRRFMYYVLIGPGFQTLYDLEALACSVNLVVNDKDVQYMETLLRKGMQDYQDLWGPLLAVLKEQGRR